MSRTDQEHLDHVFGALSHPVRRAMLRRLARGEQSISELAAPFEMSLEAASKHVRVLERARLLRRTRIGREHRCEMAPASLGDAARVLAELSGMWNRQLDSLERLLATMQPRREGKRG